LDYWEQEPERLWDRRWWVVPLPHWLEQHWGLVWDWEWQEQSSSTGHTQN
jgi:hypothetical protein